MICPASNPRMVAKAAASEADLAILDLEDAVAPAAKVAARAAIVAAFRDLDWGGKPRAYRINALDTPWCYRDLIEIVEPAAELVDRIIVPKVENAGDIAFVDRLLTQLERAAGRATPIAIEAQIESPTGLSAAREIAAASARVAALVFGPGDYAAAAGMPLTAIGTPDAWDAAYAGHRWGYAMHELLIAARSAGARAIDGPYADFRDLDGFRRTCGAARALGYDGKWCIHPSQIPVANSVFRPTADELAAARAVLVAYEASLAAGCGALALDGMMVDAASLRMARATLARAGDDGSEST
ncbi:MAG: CoA ester lyase [Thermomicrobiales bacterium]|nr:CoA ester lyase [Thermomicrobiales bacterium]